MLKLARLTSFLASTLLVLGSLSSAQAGTLSLVGDNGTSVELSLTGAGRNYAITQYSGYRAWENGTLAASCKEYRNGSMGYSYSGATGDGIYRIDVDGAGPSYQVDVQCDMTSDGGGWTVFQRRINGAVSFYRTYADYANGFGVPATEYWLGNDRLALMTATAKELRVDLTRFNGGTGYSKYTGFKVNTAADGYRLASATFAGGTAGDAMANQVGSRFSASDVDLDGYAPANCAAMYYGGWWYSACHHSNLNGLYKASSAGDATNIVWYQWTGHTEALARTEMKLR